MAKKPSKLKQQYQNIRKQLTRQRSKMIQKYGRYYELPFSLKDLGIKKATANDYRQAIKEMKQFKSMMMENEQIYKQQQIEASKQAIEYFLTGLDTGEGGQIIITKTNQLIGRYGEVKVATAIQKMMDEGDVITKLEFYREKNANAYMGRMADKLVSMGVMTESEMRNFQQSIEPMSEYVDVELQ